MNLYVDIKTSFSEIESAYVTRSKTAPHERESKFKEKGEKQEDRKWDPVGKLLPPSTSKAVQVAEVFADVGNGHAADPLQGPAESAHSQLLREPEQCKRDVNVLPPFY